MTFDRFEDLVDYSAREVVYRAHLNRWEGLTWEVAIHPAQWDADLNDWITDYEADTGDMVTDVPSEDRNVGLAQAAACDLLAEEGWKVTSDWEDGSNETIAFVSRARRRG